MKSKFANILEGVKTECEKRGMKVLPPLTERERIDKRIEINARNEVNDKQIEARRVLTESEKNEIKIKQAEAVEKFYANARRKD